MMQIFSIGPIFEQIRETLEAGEEVDPAITNLLVSEGPKAIDDFWMAIDGVQGEIDTLKAHLVAIKARMDAREKTVEHMKGVVQDLLVRHFDKKVKTSLGTYWVQGTPTYEVVADFTKNPEFFKTPDPVLEKKKVIEVYKQGTLPDTITVTESSTESVRCRR
jgi:Siphovirus Gp157